MNRWISTSERLPDVNVPVMFWTGKDYWHAHQNPESYTRIGRRMRVGSVCGEGRPDRDKVSWYEFSCRSVYDEDLVTHWMPLPNPPPGARPPEPREPTDNEREIMRRMGEQIMQNPELQKTIEEIFQNWPAKVIE